MRWKSWCIAILFCIYLVVKYINGWKLIYKNHFWELLTNKVRKLFVFIMWTKKTQNNAGLGFNSLTSCRTFLARWQTYWRNLKSKLSDVRFSSLLKQDLTSICNTGNKILLLFCFQLVHVGPARNNTEALHCSVGSFYCILLFALQDYWACIG